MFLLSRCTTINIDSSTWCLTAGVILQKSKARMILSFPKSLALCQHLSLSPYLMTLERLFSVLSVIKTKLRNRLAIPMHCNSEQHSQSLVQSAMRHASPWQFFWRCLLDSTCPFTITSAINLEHQGQQGSRRMKKMEVSSSPMCCSWVNPFCSPTDLAENWFKNLRVRCCWCWW